MADDLEWLIAMGGPVAPGPAPGDQPSVEVNPALEAIDAPGDAAIVGGPEVLEELVAWQQMGEPPARTYRQRSWELLAHARATKARRTSERRAEAAESQAVVLSNTLSAVAEQFPAVARSVGIKALRKKIKQRFDRHVCPNLVRDEAS